MEELKQKKVKRVGRYKIEVYDGLWVIEDEKECEIIFDKERLIEALRERNLLKEEVKDEQYGVRGKGKEEHRDNQALRA